MTYMQPQKTISKFGSRSGVVLITVFLALCLQLVLLGNNPVFAEEDNDSDGVKVFQSDDGNSIIPKPGSGTPPSSATDRGGALQLTLLGLLILFPIIAILSVRRQGRKSPGKT